ncbi:MAG: methyltransferase domain-containing protein [Deltaproteobacteria bacterium]|nr:methyltransferase domain-containing protein [Deltaproteobacteria bacterium]
MSKRKFFIEFLKNWRGTGSIIPSSRFLTRKMLEAVDFDSTQLIIEFGPGTGPFTKALLKRLGPQAKLWVVEMNPKFCKALEKIQDQRLRIIHDSADQIKKYLNGKKADYILSGLPLAVFKKELNEQILHAVLACLKESGKFIQFQYSRTSHRLLKSFFPQVKIKFTPLNTPPAFVYVCSQGAD